ncbi:MAG: bifunctional 4'-phosphopantothenoylcysteine decarboxylase/phosphopantothenoylcysteine synthetase, partial [Kiritimatiellae bacterium]|nr:bifunctional 4'-phosphopantothenoylcysteine decarboxylase/phosphopantothenoylcysteine synthetase [Kiritimatiellia bacterium]
RQILVGFAAETGEPTAEAVRKCREKRLDLVVANDVTAAGSGFGTATNRVSFVFPDGRIERLPLLSKAAVARRIVNAVKELVADKSGLFLSRDL